MMPPDTDKVHVAVVVLQTQLSNLSERLDEIEEKTVTEHRKVHDIVVATSEAIRNLTRTVDEMRPLTDDYREKRAEARGAENLKRWLFALAASVGGFIVFILGKTFDLLANLFQARPPHP